jgi:hypothetical protein
MWGIFFTAIRLQAAYFLWRFGSGLLFQSAASIRRFELDLLWYLQQGIKLSLFCIEALKI